MIRHPSLPHRPDPRFEPPDRRAEAVHAFALWLIEHLDSADQNDVQFNNRGLRTLVKIGRAKFLEELKGS